MFRGWIYSASALGLGYWAYKKGWLDNVPNRVLNLTNLWSNGTTVQRILYGVSLLYVGFVAYKTGHHLTVPSGMAPTTTDNFARLSLVKKFGVVTLMGPIYLAFEGVPRLLAGTLRLVDNGVITVLDSLDNLVNAMGRGLRWIGINIIVPSFEWVVNNIQAIFTAIGDVIVSAFRWIGPKIVAVVRWIGDRLVDFFDAILPTMRWIGTQIVRFFTAFSNAVRYVFDMVKNIFTAIGNAIQWVFTTFWNGIVKVLTFVFDILVKIGTVIAQGWEWLGKRIAEIMTWIVNTVVKIYQAIYPALCWVGRQIQWFFERVLVPLVNNFISLIKEIFNVVYDGVSFLCRHAWTVIKFPFVQLGRLMDLLVHVWELAREAFFYLGRPVMRWLWRRWDNLKWVFWQMVTLFNVFGGYIGSALSSAWTVVSTVFSWFGTLIWEAWILSSNLFSRMSGRFSAMMFSIGTLMWEAWVVISQMMSSAWTSISQMTSSNAHNRP